MAEIINYIWQSSFCLLFLFGVYWCFLREEKAFTLARAFILAAPVMALLFPLLEIPVDFAKPSISLENTDFLKSLASLQEQEEIVGTFGLPEFTVKSSKLPLLMEVTDYLLLGYLGIVLLLASRLVWQFSQINLILRKGWYQTVYKLKGSYFLVPTFGLAPVFSFFDKLFWDETQQLTEQERDQIIQHELEHIRQRHSWDILYYQLLCVFFWFNPAIHLMRTALVDTHEFLADANVLRRIENKESYRKLIVKIAFRGLDLPIGNYFIRSTTLKRVLMMKKPSKTNWFKLLMVLPLTCMLLVLVSMKTLPDSEFLKSYLPTNISYLPTNIIPIKQQIQAAHDSIEVTTKVKRIKSPVHYEYISEMKNGQLTAQFGDLQYEIGEISDNKEYLKVLQMLQVFKGSSSFHKDYGEGVMNKVDKMPIPKGGHEGWNRFLNQNLKMPDQARDIGVDGIVYAQFIVDKEGNINSHTILKSLGMGLDDEVLRILNLPEAANWSPGQVEGEPVNTLMTIPVRFKTLGIKEETKFLPNLSHMGKTINLNGEELFDVVDKMPAPRGGSKGWNDYLADNLKYSDTANKAGMGGTVYLEFIVDKEGNITNPKILRGIGFKADKEAIRLVKNSSPWIPGTQNGKKANVKMRVPIRFQFEENRSSHSVSFPENTLDQVVVNSYGASKTADPRFLPAKKVIDLRIQGDNNILIFEKVVAMDDLVSELSDKIKEYEADGISKSDLVIEIKASKNIRLSQVHDIQDIMRKAGISQVKYPSLDENLSTTRIL